MMIDDTVPYDDDEVLSYDGSAMAFGIDQSSRPPPSPAALTAAGVKFMNHYIADRDPDGNITITNWETSADAMKGGYDRGVEAARNSLAMAKLCGLPNDRPIYFSADTVDFNTYSTYRLARDFLQGAASVLGSSRVGVYGSYYVVDWAYKDTAASWFWQTYAWSNHQWHSVTHIRQYPDAYPNAPDSRFHVTIGGVQCDIDRSVVADFGQWPGGELFMWTDAEQARILKAADQILGAVGAGKFDFSTTVEGILATVQSLVNLGKTQTSTLANLIGQTDDQVLVGLVAYLTANPVTANLSDADAQELLDGFKTVLTNSGITATVDSNVLLDALKTRLEA